MAELTQGNNRFATQHLRHPHQDRSTRKVLATEQHPFAAILSCADSRVPPELVFDEGLGDLFVVRVAGNIVDDAVIGSLEYAAEHLHVPAILVLGHTGCGAVDATIKGGEANTHIQSLVKAIQPAVDAASHDHEAGTLIDKAVRENVRMTVRQLQNSEPLLSKLVSEGHLQIVGAVYDLATGTVTFLH